jgi:sulfatase modifying factor 1
MNLRLDENDAAPPGMTFIPGGVFVMGSERFYADEAPCRRVRVDGFWIDTNPVTNRQFAEFVDATGHHTLAENPPDPRDYPDLPPGDHPAVSLVFQQTAGPVPLDDYSRWWALVPGADWRHPTGPDSSIDAIPDHPVVHVAWDDAAAYARWSGKSLPSEAEWELAARGGLDDADYAWGEALEPEGRILANYWRGAFPFWNEREDGGYRTTAVGSYPANGHGLYDMIGNVWEWTADWYAEPVSLIEAGAGGKSPCCAIPDPRGGTLTASREPGHGGTAFGRKVLKGGSHLCAANYCQRYRPAARHAQSTDSATSHIGFRCVVRR